jgi:dihydropyrimidinase
VWSEEGPRRADVRVVGERIEELGALALEPGESVIEAAGLHVLPGMIDIHVHVDDHIGAYELADTWPTASEIAVRTGVTTLAGFVTQQPGEPLVQAIERCLARARKRSHCDYTFHLTSTAWPWEWREVEGLIGRGFSTFKLYTTYREAGLFTDYVRLTEIMERLAALGARLLVHCEDDAMLAAADGSCLNPTDARGYAVLRPEAAEVVAIRKVVELAARTGCPTHVVHVSTAEGAEVIGQARIRARVTCETAPHYLLLTDAALAGPQGHRWLCTPPLRDEANRARMEQMSADGVFDLFATDHCAFARADKDAKRGDFREVPKGLAGLGALVPLMHELLVRKHRLPLAELAARLSRGPAKLLGLYPRKGTVAAGSDADLVILDVDGPERPVVSSLADTHESYPGRTTTLDVKHVLVRGRRVVENNALVAPGRPAGRHLTAA